MRNFKGWVIFTLLLAGIVGFSGLSFAEEGVLKLTEVVVTATKQERLAKDVPATVTVITKEEIEKSGARTLPELLKTIPGITIYDKYGEGVGASMMMRGHYHAGHSYGYYLVLVDGVPMVAPDTGNVYLDMMPLSNIERIEVVMGPGSALWGGNAVGGTINIITKKPSPEPQANVNIKYGAWGMKHASFYGQVMGSEGWKKDLSLAISAESKEGDGWRDHSAYDLDNYWLKISKELEEWDAKLDLSISSATKNQEWAGRINEEMWKDNELRKVWEGYKTKVWDETAGDYVYKTGVYNHIYGDYREDYQRLGFEKGVEAGRLKGNLYHYFKKYELFHPPFYFTNVPAWGGGIQYEFGISNHSLILGADYQSAKVKQNVVDADTCFEPVWDPAKKKYRRHTFTKIKKPAFYIQDSWKITEKWELILGTRFDRAEFDNDGWKYDSAGTSKVDISEKTKMEGWSPKGSLLYKMNENLNLFASAGKAFKIPDPYKLYVSKYANSDLEPEIATTYEIGAKYASDMWMGAISYYWGPVEDLIVLNKDKDQYENIGKTFHEGIEAKGVVTLREDLTLSFSCDWTKAKIIKEPAYEDREGKYIYRTPEHKLTLGLDYTPEGGFFASLSLKDVGHWWMDNENEYKYPGYTLLDGRVGYKTELGDSEVTVSLNVNNILDTKYAPSAYASYGKKYYYPGLPMNAYLEVGIKF